MRVVPAGTGGRRRAPREASGRHPRTTGSSEKPAAYGEMRNRALRAWKSDERMAGPVRVPWGEVPGRDALSAYVMEIVAHTWDLSEGLGRPLALDPEPAEYSRRRRGPPSRTGRARGAASHRRWPPPGGGADAYGRMAAWLGRRPLPRTA